MVRKHVAPSLVHMGIDENNHFTPYYQRGRNAAVSPKPVIGTYSMSML